jgi:CAAX protease family protein
MDADPELLPPAAAPELERAPASVRVCCIVPNLGHTLLFMGIVLFALLLNGLVLGSLMQRLSWVRHQSLQQMQTDPRVVIPLEVAMYAVAALLAYLVFPRIWRRAFASGIRWNSGAVRRHWLTLVFTGVVLSIAIQLLSNYLPIPKSLPIDKFFQNPLGVWLVAIFGVTVAPAFEELAFRGFLLPSLANTWEFLTRDRSLPRPEQPTPSGDPRWSASAIIFATVLTSIAFALIHADQLAHAWAPLSVLFCVSLVLCLVRLRTHSLAASAFVHAVYNATIFALLFAGTSGFRHLDKIGT